MVGSLTLILERLIPKFEAATYRFGQTALVIALSVSRSYSTLRDKNIAKLTRLTVGNRKFDGRTPDSPAMLANPGMITQLSDQITSLNERMDEFTSQIEELNSKISVRKSSISQQNLVLQAEASCNASAPTSIFVSNLGNGTLAGSLMPRSSSSTQLAKESPLMEEIMIIARSQRQIMHRLDNLCNLLHEDLGELTRQGRTDGNSILTDANFLTSSLILTLAIGGISFVLFKGMS